MANRRDRAAFVSLRWGTRAVLVLIPAIVIVVWLASRDARSQPTPGSHPDAILSRNFKLLRRPVEPGDALPADYQSMSFRLMPSSWHLLPRLTRRAVLPSTKLEMWLEPGSNAFCVFIAEKSPTGPITGGFGPSCTSIRSPIHAELTTGGGAFLAAGPSIRPLTPRVHLVYGVAPDNVKQIRLVTKDRRTTSIPLTEGFFALRFSVGDKLYERTAGHLRPLKPPGLG